MKVNSAIGFKPVYSRSFKPNETVDKYLFRVLIGLFICMLLARDVGGLPVSKYVYIGIAVAIYLLCEQSYILAFLAFITPISLGISYTFMILIAVVFIFFKSEKIVIGKEIVFPFIIIFLELVNSLVSQYDTIPEFVRTIEIIVLITLLFLDRSKSYDYRFILKMYLVGFWLLAIFTVYWVASTGSVEEFLQTGTTLRFSLVEEIEGNLIFAASNMMGLYAVMSIAVSLLLMLVKQGNRIILFLTIMLSFSLGFISTSRGFVFSSLLCLLLYIFFSVKSIKGLIRVVFLITVFCLVVVLLVNTVLSGAYTTFVNKMGMEDFSNGRIALFRYYNEIYLSSPKIFLVGVGLQNYVYKCGSPGNSIHNAIQEVLIAWGIVGLFCVTGFFSSLYKNTVRYISKASKKYIYLIPALTYLFYVQFNRIFSVRSASIMIIIVLCALALNRQVSEMEGENGLV